MRLNKKFEDYTEDEMMIRFYCDALKREMLKGQEQDKGYMLELSKLIDRRRQLMKTTEEA